MQNTIDELRGRNVVPEVSQKLDFWSRGRGGYKLIYVTWVKTWRGVG